MAVQRDYVMRLIAEAARLVALALGLRRAGDPEEAAARLDDASRLLTGQPLDVLLALGPDALAALAEARGGPDLAVALADVLDATGTPEGAERALALYAHALAGGAAVPLPALQRLAASGRVPPAAPSPDAA